MCHRRSHLMTDHRIAWLSRYLSDKAYLLYGSEHGLQS